MTMAFQVESYSFEINFVQQVEKAGLWYKLNLKGVQDISPRLGHSLVAYQNGKIVLVGGGNHEGAMSDLWELDLLFYKTNGSDSGEQQNSRDNGGDDTSGAKKLPVIEGLKSRYEFLCTKLGDEYEKSKLWIFGGADSKLTFNDIGYIHEGGWIESVSSSSSTKCSVPAPRTQGGNSALVEVDGKSYLSIFAGGLAGVDAVEDGNLYLYDVEDQNWICAPVFGDTPPVTQGHVLTAFGSKIFVHGGLNGTTLHENLYMIDVSSVSEPLDKPRSWMPVESCQEVPSGRAGHGIAKGPEERSKFYIFGGLGQAGCLNDLWEFNTESQSWSKLTSMQSIQPSPRFGVGMTAISIENEMRTFSNYLVIHGGMNSGGELFNDMWIMKL